MLIRENVCYVINWRKRYVTAKQGRQLSFGPYRGKILQQSIHLISDLEAGRVRGVARVFRELRAIDDTADLTPEVRLGSSQGNPSVGRWEQSEGAEQGMTIALRSWCDAREAVLVNDPFADRQDAVDHSHVNELAASRAARFHERGDYSECRQCGGNQVSDTRTDLQRDAFLSCNSYYSAHGLGDNIEGWPIYIGTFSRAGIAESANGGIDETRVALRKDLIREAEAIHDSGSEVLDHSICSVDETQKHLLAFR
jgi:hypothetical protein